MKAYRSAKSENEQAKQTIISYVNSLAQDNSYKVFTNTLLSQIQREGY